MTWTMVGQRGQLGQRRASCQRVNISVTYRRLITVERGYRSATGRTLH